MVLTLAAVAETKQIPLEHLSAQVTLASKSEPGRPARTRFTVALHLGGPLSARERKILFNSARSCDVRKLLQGQVEFEERPLSE